MKLIKNLKNDISFIKRNLFSKNLKETINLYTFLFLLLAFSFFISCSSDSCQNSTLNDKVKIGQQVWMPKNLDIDRFQNGDKIPEAKTQEEWDNASKNKKPAWCYYDNNPSNADKYGKIYNWYAVNDPRGLAPVGWHIPSNAEWKKLSDFLGDRNYVGAKLKSNCGWNNNQNGTNESSFSGFPGGYRTSNGIFKDFGSKGFWWSISLRDFDRVSYYILNSNNGQFQKSDRAKADGLSVRCIENTKEYLDSTQIIIGKQIWKTKNLDTDRFRNGDLIQEAKSQREWEIAAESKKPAWCYYNNDKLNGAKYGKLYNWYAVNDSRGLAPNGWHIPSQKEINILIDFINSDDPVTAGIIGKKMKSINGWSQNNGTNESGFNALPGGFRLSTFGNIEEYGYWWTTSQEHNSAYCFWLSFQEGPIFDLNFFMTGVSVRCVKD